MKQENKDEYLFTDEEIKLIEKYTGKKIKNRKVYTGEKPIELYSDSDNLFQSLWDMHII